jgi:hypothetical protein
MPVFASYNAGETAGTSGLVEVESCLHILALPPQSFHDIAM